MTTARIKVNPARKDSVAHNLRNRTPFDAGNMRGMTYRSMSTGRLPAPYKVPEDVRYMVMSYATPIAWVTRDGVVIIPDVRYSVTTTHHQTLCRAWLDYPS